MCVHVQIKHQNIQTKPTPDVSHFACNICLKE